MRNFSSLLLVLAPIVIASPLVAIEQYPNEDKGFFSLLRHQSIDRESSDALKQGGNYGHEHIPSSALLRYMPNYRYNYGQENDYASVVQGTDGDRVSNMVVYKESTIYTEIPSYTIPDTSTVSSDNLYIIDFPSESSVE